MSYPTKRKKWTEKELKQLEIIGSFLPIKLLCEVFDNHTRLSILDKMFDKGIKKKERTLIEIKNNKIDDSLGNYISGFTDGEGCFSFRKYTLKKDNSIRYIAEFRIALRGDDKQILDIIRNYFGCGKVMFRSRKSEREKGKNVKDQFEFRIANTWDLWTKVIPHFDRFKLRAKKKRDYITWREAVKFTIEKNRKFTVEDRKKLENLVNKLKYERGWYE